MNSITSSFTSQVKLSPNHLAVVFEDQQLTYQELNDRSNQLANLLLRKGLEVEELVPICLNRSVELIIGILGILKAGGAYVPVDPAYPKDRINYIIHDTKAKFVVTDHKSSHHFVRVDSDISSLVVDSISDELDFIDGIDPHVHLQGNHLAYVIYTSGSTGNPKGVMIEQHAVCKYIAGQTKIFGISNLDHVLQFSSFCFDASVEQIFIALLNGATLHLLTESVLKDHERFGNVLNEKKITYLHATPGLLDNLNPVDFKYLKHVIAGGDVCSKELAEKWSAHVDFYNEYGPTEITVAATAYKCEKESLKDLKAIPIGKALNNMKVYLLDEHLNTVEDGAPGELYIGGDRLARGYLNLPDLTASVFIKNPFLPGERLYKTADIGQLMPDGNILFLGRSDDQVKIRGYRIELGEIESCLHQFTGIKKAIVLASNSSYGDKKLIAYYQGDISLVNLSIIKFLRKKLPEYMIPQIYVPIPSVPLTRIGKVDKKALLSIKLDRPSLASIYKKPQKDIEYDIYRLWADFLEIEKIGIDDNFFELGGDSLMAQRIIGLLKVTYPTLSISKLYQFPTIGGLAQYLDKSKRVEIKQSNSLGAGTEIAVIGMAGRFPGADTIDELWKLLIDGKEAITFFEECDLDSSIPQDIIQDHAYVKARGIIKDADKFDPSFFGINSKLAELMDPQQRIFLEISWEALERLGYLSGRQEYRIGVFAGAGINTYFENNVLAYPELIENQGKFQVNSVNDKDFIASRTAYHLNLKGPAVNVNSACSTSLLAIAQAVCSLRAGQCEVALAGAASISSPINSGHLYQEGSMLSADGHCTPFNANSTGTLFSDGAGVVVLKTLAAAKRDGDHIFALIKGIGINNDGGGKGSFTAPSTSGQADAITMAINDADISAADISYVEAHGTATPLGDPIEFDGLVEAFGLQELNQYCAIGSIKSNIGHLTHAAGVAGFIKTCFALQNKMIPASLGYNQPNPHIDFANSPFYVNAKLTDWDDNKKRLAGVSSFGVGGTNVHVILESYENEIKENSNVAPYELIRWSAENENSLLSYEHALADYLQNKTNVSLADIAYTLHATRKAFRVRKFTVASSTEAIAETLKQQTVPFANMHTLLEAPSKIVFIFPGQGAQYVDMGLALYQQEPIYKAAINQCASILQDFIGQDIREIIFPSGDISLATNKLKDTRYTQPALFVTEFALANLWMSWGIKPDIFIGHSVGEYVAAHLAGVLSLTDALKLVAKRGELISSLPSGSMLSVRQNASIVRSLLKEDLCIAAVNGPMLCVVSGPSDQILSLSELLNQQEIPNKPLFTSHAFHSSMMEPILADFRAIVSEVTLTKPSITIISTVTGEILTDQLATDIDYWTTHLRNTVEFVKAVEMTLQFESSVFLEVGPGTVTSTLIKQIALSNNKSVKTVFSLKPGQDAGESILNAIGLLWINGVDIDHNAYYTNQSLLELPTYQFNRQKYWLRPRQHNVNKTNPTGITEYNSITPSINKLVNMRKENLTEEVKQVLEDASGIEMSNIDSRLNFLELGFDSLLLTQVATSLKRKFNLPITFRKLNEEYNNLPSLVSYLDANMPAQSTIQAPLIPEQNAPITAPANYGVYQQPLIYQAPQAVNADHTALGLIAQQLNILTQQLVLLQGQNTLSQSLNFASPHASSSNQNLKGESLSVEEKQGIQKPFGATPKIDRLLSSLTVEQAAFIKSLTARYNSKTAKSKAYTNESRPYMADPRVVTGFRPTTKELVYPIVINKSKGSKLWDLDGNEYIDALNGFGSNLLGHQPDVIMDALHEQLEKGYEVGPQHELAASVAKLVCEFTGFDRSALCSTGSEAVLGCIRIARTVTGRSLIVSFSGSYHGIIDEVLVRGTRKLKSFPAAAGIMPEAVQNILVLEYGTPESLAIIRERGAEIAAVLVETIQSRRPEFVPIEFLSELRSITKENGSVLIFDEVITGFRFHPGGAQSIFNIKADLAAYGKVVGGGMPIGIIAGVRYLMDALDGGNWQYGDESVPEIGVTYFAGTFVRHPMALAAAYASLKYMKAKGPALQLKINEKGNYLSKVLNQAFEKRKLPIFVANHGSLWKVKYHQEIPYSELMFVLLREKGIHIIDGFPCFITEATSDIDIQKIISAFIESMDEMINIGFFPSTVGSQEDFDTSSVVIDGNMPPVAGAKLGKDIDGNPAWFLADTQKDGKYFQIAIK
ncbi:MAG: amino acid adenylation domain-containing protein [Flavobacteriales bacterium]|nr:MAG: amino acid adenylation domain-containing protein [Flavobacteriales bacterium]